MMYAEAKRQALLGVLFKGVERVPEEQRPTRDVVLKWYSVKERIVKCNRLMNRRVMTLMEGLTKDGMRPCLLKGQGVATLYDEPLLRMPGDIDVWTDVAKCQTIDYVRRHCGGGRDALRKGTEGHGTQNCGGSERCGGLTVCPHHVDFPVFEDAEVELHFRPAVMMNPLTDMRLRRFFRRHGQSVSGGGVTLDCGDRRMDVPVPTAVFNAVFLLVHSFKHFISEGIGLRQMMDYYWLLERGLTAAEADEARAMFRRLHIARFAGAVMYVMREVFGLERSKMIVPENVREGQILLDSIMEGGNFGHYSAAGCKRPGGGHVVRFLRGIPHSLRLLRHYPSEVIFAPLYSIYFFFHLRAYRLA